jgi:hypothetical protein
MWPRRSKQPRMMQNVLRQCRKEVNSISRVIGMRLLILMFWFWPKLELDVAVVAAALAISEMSAAVVAVVRVAVVEVWGWLCVPDMATRMRKLQEKGKRKAKKGRLRNDLL